MNITGSFCSSPDTLACGKSTGHFGLINVAFFWQFCSVKCSAPATWLLQWALQDWLLVQRSPPCFGSLLNTNYFQHFLKKSNKLQTDWRERTAWTVSLSLRKTATSLVKLSTSLLSLGLLASIQPIPHQTARLIESHNITSRLGG